MDPVKKGSIVLYVMKQDFDPNDVVPNICPAIVTKVRPSPGEGKPASVALRVFTPTGSFCDEYVVEDQGGSRGTWHWK